MIPRRAPPSQEDVELVNLLVEHSRKAVDMYLQELVAKMPGSTQARLLISDDVADSLHELAEIEEVDLVVLSAHGSSGKRRWPFGSLTTSFIQYGGTPLLIVQDFARNELAPSRAALAVEQHKGH